VVGVEEISSPQEVLMSEILIRYCEM